MRYETSLILATVFVRMVEEASSLPLRHFQHSLALKRVKRDPPTGNIYDPPLPVFPSKENAPFWNPAPYPFPATVSPPPSVPRHKLPYYDPNNPYLDAMTNGYWPNFGLGYANQNPTQVGGSIHWPTGNALMPSDQFNGTIGFANPQQLRVGMQGGPFFPYQSPQYIKNAKDINDATLIQQAAQMQSESRGIGVGNSVQQGVPSGLIPVQQQLFAQQQQVLPASNVPVMPLQQQQQQQFFPRSQQIVQQQPAPVQQAPIQRAPSIATPNHRVLSFASAPNPFVS